MTTDRMAIIRGKLETAFAPRSLEVDDDSALHIGHPGARSGGHYTVRIVAEAFTGRSRLERHRLVYQALGDLMQNGIHALRIQAGSPDELH